MIDVADFKIEASQNDDSTTSTSDIATTISLYGQNENRYGRMSWHLEVREEVDVYEKNICRAPINCNGEYGECWQELASMLTQNETM